MVMMMMMIVTKVSHDDGDDDCNCHQGGPMMICNRFHNEYFGLPAKYDRHNSRVLTTL